MKSNSLFSQQLPLTGAAQLRRSRGFTLIELMIVLGIIAVLAAIAYASYQRNVIESRRKAAAACLLESSQFMERYYTTTLSYAGAALPPLTCRNDLAIFYTFALVGTPDATNYQISATPLNQQLARDTACGTLTITQSGTKGRSGTGPLNDCW